MWTRRIIVCLFSYLLSPQLSADANLGGVQIQLTQRPDVGCDGMPDNTDRIAPGSCIIYEIQAVNTDNKTHRNILVSARIPEHSTLVQPYARANDSAPVDSIINQDADGIRLLRTRLETLHPGHDNKVILHYSVRIL